LSVKPGLREAAEPTAWTEAEDYVSRGSGPIRAANNQALIALPARCTAGHPGLRLDVLELGLPEPALQPPTGRRMGRRIPGDLLDHDPGKGRGCGNRRQKADGCNSQQYPSKHDTLPDPNSSGLFVDERDI